MWDVLDDTPTTVETVLLRTGLSLATVGLAVSGLEERGLVVAGAGWWSRA